MSDANGIWRREWPRVGQLYRSHRSISTAPRQMMFFCESLPGAGRGVVPDVRPVDIGHALITSPYDCALVAGVWQPALRLISAVDVRHQAPS